MSLARCMDEEKPVGRGLNVYVASHKPIGYPVTGVICGSRGYAKPALLWVTACEQQEYQAGERVFSLPSNGAKVRVE